LVYGKNHYLGNKEPWRFRIIFFRQEGKRAFILAVNLIAQVRPNDKVQLTAIRYNKILKLSAVAAKRPKEI
jgi:hypothetical protein